MKADELIKDINQAEFNRFVEGNEREICKNDVFYFIENYVKIEDRDVEGSVIPFRLWDKQRGVLADFLVNRLIQVMKANQLGLTWLIIAYATWNLLFKSGYSAKGISETENKAKEITRRVDFILRHLPDFLATDQKSKSAVWYETTALGVTFHHPKIDNKPQEDSNIQTFASSATAGAGFTANLFLFDEWALQQYAREIWTYAYPTINRPSGGQVIGISTIERGTLFEEIWRRNKNFKKIFLAWDTDPRRDRKWYQNTLDDLGLDETRKHYPATPQEALAIPGGAFFSKFDSKVHIKEPLEFIPDYFNKYRVLDYGLDMLACYFVWVDTRGFVRIYKEIHEPGLVISDAAYLILKESGASVPSTTGEWNGLTVSEKQNIASTAKENFYCTFAPPDLFGKSKETSKDLDLVWNENGIILTKTKNNFEQGCISLSQYLKPFAMQSEETGLFYSTAKLTIDQDRDDPMKSCAPNLEFSLLNIQKDKNRPEVYAKEPHYLTHSCDAIRYLCAEFLSPSINKEAIEAERLRKLRLTPEPHYSPLYRRKLNDRQLKF